MSYGFRFLLVQPDGEPFNPAALVSAAPNHDVGDAITFGAGDQARVLGVQREDLADELVEQGFVGILTVEPLE